MNPKYSPAQLDTMAKTMTYSTLTLSICATWFLKEHLSLFTIAIIWVPLLFSYFFSPRYYNITDQNLIIHRFLGNTSLNRASIISAEMIESIKVSRNFGSGGLWGYWGSFSLQDKRIAFLYCTTLRNIVLIQTKDKTIIISPENPQQFLSKLLEPAIQQPTNES